MGQMRAEVDAPSHRLDLLVVGHTNIDHFLHVPQLPTPDRTVPILRQESALGGTAANIALSAARWGVATGLHSFVGPDFPETFRHLLVRAGVDVSGLVTVNHTTSPTCYIALNPRGSQQTLIFQGPMENASSRAPPRHLLGESGWLHLTTGDPEYQLRVAREARRLGRRIVADPAQEVHYRWDARRLKEFVSRSEVLFGNSAEVRRVEQLLGARDTRALLEWVPMVIETKGRRGVTAHTRRGAVRVAGIRPRRLRSITGAGDAFRGGFYAGWFAGQDLESCLRAGVRSATRWIEYGPPWARPRRKRR